MMKNFEIICIILCSTNRIVLPAVIGKLGSNEELQDNRIKITPLRMETYNENINDLEELVKKTKLNKVILAPHRHIGRVPQPPYPIFNDPPSGLSADQKHSSSKWTDDSLSAQRHAFISILNEHQRHPKRSKHVSDEDRYIILSFDPKTKKYSIKEESSE